MSTKTKTISPRKPIFVAAEVYAKFKKAAQADGRKYSAFLETLLEK